MNGFVSTLEFLFAVLIFGIIKKSVRRTLAEISAGNVQLSVIEKSIKNVRLRDDWNFSCARLNLELDLDFELDK